MTAVDTLIRLTPPLAAPAAPAQIGSGGAAAPAEISQGSAAPVPPKEIPEAPSESKPPPKPSREQAAKNLADAKRALQEAELDLPAKLKAIAEELDGTLININNARHAGEPDAVIDRRIQTAQITAHFAMARAMEPVERLRRSVEVAMRDSDHMNLHWKKQELVSTKRRPSSLKRQRKLKQPKRSI